MLRTTKVTAIVIVPVLLAAFVILFGISDRTEQLWAWTMVPEMTAITMGAGYLGGAWFFTRVARNRHPDRVVGGLAAATVFTGVLGVATVLHWDRFNHDHVSFWAWLLLYTVSPVLLPFLAVGNRRAALAAEPDDRRPPGRPLPNWAWRSLAVVGAVQVSAAACWFVKPSLAMQIWPWDLTPVTARSLSAYVAFTGLFLLWPLFDRRREAVQIGLEAVMVGLTATAVGSIIGRSDFTGPTGSRVVFGVGLAALLVLLATVLLSGRERARAPAAARAA